VEVEELHPGLPRQVLLLLLVEVVDVLRPLAVLEGVPAAVQLVEDADVGVTFDRMAGVDQGPGLGLSDGGNHVARERVELLSPSRPW
jgi:hypothetical protein